MPLQASASILTIFTSSYCFCSWSSIGSTSRQGPHQWAVKSTSTACELLACMQRQCFTADASTASQCLFVLHIHHLDNFTIKVAFADLRQGLGLQMAAPLGGVRP